jgi:hypothetical protein
MAECHSAVEEKNSCIFTLSVLVPYYRAGRGRLKLLLKTTFGSLHILVIDREGHSTMLQTDFLPICPVCPNPSRRSLVFLMGDMPTESYLDAWLKSPYLISQTSRQVHQA